MNDPETRYQELIARLKEQDYRLTPQRMELVRLISRSEGHPSAAQLFAAVKRRFPTMSQATVYKTLSLLKDMGQVLEIDLREDSRYDGNRPHPHPHLVCTHCGRIVDGELELDPALIASLEAVSGFRSLQPQITFSGLCPDCQAGSG